MYESCYMTYQVVATGVIGSVKGLAITGIDQEVLGALGEAVASIEAEFAEEWDLLQVDNHVLHQFKLADHLFLLLGKLGSADFFSVTQTFCTFYCNFRFKGITVD